jgi:hypothetical protein
MTDVIEREKSQARWRGVVSDLEAMWLADGRPQHEFWAAMMAVYGGAWPGGPK